MNSFQRVIKYLAIAFAILLAVGIISAIASFVTNIISGVTGGFRFSDNRKRIDFAEDFTDVDSVDIKNAAGTLTIKTGDTFRVEAENVLQDFTAGLTPNGTLTIREKGAFSFHWFNFNGFINSTSRITVYLPEDFVADDVKLDSGAGNVVINRLQTDSLTINCGAGSVSGSDMVAEDANIDCGVGNVTMTDVSLKDADINGGVGNLKLIGDLFGDSEVGCGVGEVDLELSGSEEDYDLNIDAGLGSVRVNGEKISKSFRNRNDADNSLKVSGGVGSVNIDFKED